ncbi:MAG: threonine/serine exporter family protein, partial [bacterium]|nr:threonine/serine exporter family protein [bacterium]
ALNNLSRTLSAESDPAIAIEAVMALSRSDHTYSQLVRIAAAIISGGAFAVLFGASALEMLAAGIGAALVWSTCLLLYKRATNRFIVEFAGGAIAAASAVLFSLWLPINIDKAIIGSIMTLVPGLLLTNAVRDTISGELLSGSARMVEAVFVAIAIAAGVGAVLSLLIRLGGAL